MTNSVPLLRREDIQHFHHRGFLKVPNWCESNTVADFRKAAAKQKQASPLPMELESDLGYPGAPKAKSELGGNTPRRLLRAFGRCKQWDAHATSPQMKAALSLLYDKQDILLSQAHHNCLMTKSPKFSSDTGWHRDSRYWHFERNELITAWLALGSETEENGCLRVIPGSHKLPIDQARFDKKSFLIADHVENEKLISQSLPVELNAGDLLFFHCNLLHSASRNFTENDKLSLVFTFYANNNAPIENTRSAKLPAIFL